MCQAAYDSDVHEVYRLFRDNHKSLNVHDEASGDTPIIAACRRGNHHTVKYLMDLNADVSVRNKVVHLRLSGRLRISHTVVEFSVS